MTQWNNNLKRKRGQDSEGASLVLMAPLLASVCLFPAGVNCGGGPSRDAAARFRRQQQQESAFSLAHAQLPPTRSPHQPSLRPALASVIPNSDNVGHMLRFSCRGRASDTGRLR